MIEIISHPGKPLINHLKAVANTCVEYMQTVQLSLSVDTKVLKDLSYITGVVHDIGKGTKNFQTYIGSLGEVVPQPKHHALISAYIGKYMSKLYLENCDKVSEFDKQLLPYFVFTAVKRHHGNLKNFDYELESLDTKREDLTILIDNFYEEKIDEILNELLTEISVAFDFKQFKEYMISLDTVFEEFADFSADFLLDDFTELSREERVGYFYIHQLLFSALLYADKTDVKLGLNKLARNQVFDFDAITKFRERMKFNNPRKELDKLKNQAYFEGIDHLKNSFDINQHLYSITLPTGLGKTITSLALGMEMKSLLKEKASVNPRLIITIPFTSIIDQSYDVFNDIFENASSDTILKHHHLAEPLYKINEDNVKDDIEKGQFLIETWQSEIVVTTFVQLLESIFTNHKGKLLKFPNLVNSIIILDEIQQIKYEIWGLIRKAFKVLGEKYNCYFVLMSATQPLIFDPRSEIQELIPNHQRYFQFFNRTKLINKTSEDVSLIDFNQIVLSYHKKNAQKSLLVVLNTKKSTLDCFRYLVNEIPIDSANLYFLSTSVTPSERKIIIDLIKHPINELPNIIISTQLIEAGVDISVDTVFRALAPLDSIIQAAGRANRYADNSNLSEIYIYNIKDLEKITNRLYGKLLIAKTLNVLKPIDIIEESNYLGLIEEYFQELARQAEAVTSETLEDIIALKFEDVGKFDFIMYRKTESVFVQLNKDAKSVWDKYVKIYTDKEKDIFTKRNEFALIKAEFYDYVINVPVGYDKEYINFDSEPVMHFYLSKLDNPSRNYKYNAFNFRDNFGYIDEETITQQF